MPLDKTVIRTVIEVNQDFAKSPQAFGEQNEIWQVHVNTKENIVTMYFRNCRGLKTSIRLGNGKLCQTEIRFTPSSCIYGHNGRVLTVSEFHDAVGVAINRLLPLLRDPHEWYHLLPGSSSESRAYWDAIEIIQHIEDHDGNILASFKNASWRNAITRVWPTGVKIGGRNSERQFCIYEKAQEMYAKRNLTESECNELRNILRLEVRLKGKALIEALDDQSSIGIIDGNRRIVRFSPELLIRAHRACFNLPRGVFFENPLGTQSLKCGMAEHMGLYLAQICIQSNGASNFVGLLNSLCHYAKVTANMKSRIKRSALDCLTRHHNIASAEFFAKLACQKQPQMLIPSIEDKVRRSEDDIFRNDAIELNYRSTQETKFIPHATIPSYMIQ